MLESITRRMTDESAGGVYRFTFYCDICGKAWQSQPVKVTLKTQSDVGRDIKAEHNSAYERANLEAMRHFNRCPVCKRWVCDDCFLIRGEDDVCKHCAEKKKRGEG